MFTCNFTRWEIIFEIDLFLKFDLCLRVAVLNDKKLDRWSLVLSVLLRLNYCTFARLFFATNYIVTNPFWLNWVLDFGTPQSEARSGAVSIEFEWLTFSTPKKLNLNSKLTSILKFAKHSIVILNWFSLNISSIQACFIEIQTLFSSSFEVKVLSSSFSIDSNSNYDWFFIRIQTAVLFLRFRLLQRISFLRFPNYVSSSLLCPCSAGHLQIIPLSKSLDLKSSSI